MDEEVKPEVTQGHTEALNVDDLATWESSHRTANTQNFEMIGNDSEVHRDPDRDEKELTGVPNGKVRDEGLERHNQVPKSVTKETEQSGKDSTNENPNNTESPSTTEAKSISARKAKKRGIFVSYAPDATFFEKHIVSYTVKELKNIGFCDDVWFDKDDGIPMESPICYQQRLEIAEKCRAALLFLSDSYFSSRVCRREGKILLSRWNESGCNKDDVESLTPVRLFCVKFCRGQLPYEYRLLGEGALDLSVYPSCSVAELSSVVVGAFSEELERYAPLFGFRIPSPPLELELSKLDRQKPLSSWSISEVQAWLSALKMHAHCSLSFEENEIDGYLLLSLSETDIENQLNVDSRVARRKLLQQVKKIQEDQSQNKNNWYLKTLKYKVKEDAAYIICDPNDARLFHNLQAELTSRKIQVFKHEGLGQSKEEFLQLNAAHIAACSHVIVLLSTTAASSLFVYNEVMFADWLRKAFVVVMVTNSWDKLRPNMQAILGDCPAVNFETEPHDESMDILLYHLRPFRNMPAVILEQDFLDRMVEGLKPLRVLAVMAKNGLDKEETSTRPKIFLSYHWDVQTKVQTLVRYLESHGFQCWTDVSNVNSRCISNHEHNHESLESQIQRHIKAATAVVCCVTSKYICSENCTKDITLAESLNKPILPVLLQWVAWPPEGRVRRVLTRLRCIDMSNDSLFKKNIGAVVTHLKKVEATHSPREAGLARAAKAQRHAHVKN